MKLKDAVKLITEHYRSPLFLFQTALDVLGIDPVKQQTIFKLLSAILTLGNIEFKETEHVACPTKQKCKNVFLNSVNLARLVCAR